MKQNLIPHERAEAHNQNDEQYLPEQAQIPVVSVKSISKYFRIYRRPIDFILEFVSKKPRHSSKVVLENISLEIFSGNIVGVIGRNGAGKSTLLKIISGVMDYDTGSVKVRGKISSILELGTGFHPDYTGRQNIELGGTVIGMTAKEIETKMESIIDFAELRSVIDEPFRTYSTGMRARLTFATAISVAPNLLIVDEALSVGDLLFQEKCFRTIRKMANNGVAVLFVTHSLSQIIELCDQAILLANNGIIKHGSPREVGYAYERLLAEERKHNDLTSPRPKHRDFAEQENNFSEPKLSIKQFEILNDQGVSVRHLLRSRDYTIRILIASDSDANNLSIGFQIQRPSGLVVYGLATVNLDRLFSINAGEQKSIDFSFHCSLQNGAYILGGGIAEMQQDNDFIVLDLSRNAIQFEVSGTEHFQGVFDAKSTLISQTAASDVVKDKHAID